MIRIIAKLDVKPPFIVKPVHFEGLRKIGNSSELAKKYYEQGVDEVMYMDIDLQQYHDTIEKIRSPHLWNKKSDEWKLKQPIWKEGK